MVALAALLAGDILASAFLQNIIANSLILMITAVGIVITYASLFGLRREVLWVEALQNPAGEELPVGPQAARRLSLMAPLASMRQCTRRAGLSDIDYRAGAARRGAVARR